MPVTTSSAPRIAVVGGGPAAMGAVLGLLERFPAARILVADYAAPAALRAEPGPKTTAELPAFYEGIYRELWKGRPRAFPPPKTHFAAPLPKFPIQGGGSVFRSQQPGGLSNFWGATCLPFTDREFAGWPGAMAALDRSYLAVASEIGISGRADGLNRYFAPDYVNRPAMDLLPVMDRLEAAVDAGPAEDGWSLAAGVNRVALETRPGRTNSCVVCGECMAGCAQGAIYSTRHTWKRWEQAGSVEFLNAPVTRLLPAGRGLVLGGDGSPRTLEGFDAIFVAAGCPNTTALLLHSFGVREPVEMNDNAVFVFPIFKATPPRPPSPDRYLSLNNLILAAWREGEDHRYAQALIYPNFDYLWRYNTPPFLWPAARALTRFSRQRMLWARLYLHGDDSQTYALRVDEAGRPLFETARKANTGKARDYIAQIRRTLGRGGFRIPPVPPIHQKTNSHYACTLPPGNKLLPVTPGGEVAPGLYVCDSTIFPSLPAVSLTLTIMAQAHRIAATASI